MNSLTKATIEDYARQIADEITAMARVSGDDPIMWVTGNNYMPPMRSFTLAERIWQDEGTDGEDFAYLCEEVERILGENNVALECPEYDNALYAVDLARFEYVEDSNGDTLQSEWRKL